MARHRALTSLLLTLAFTGAPWLVLAQDPPEPPPSAPSATPPEPPPEDTAPPPASTTPPPPASTAPPPPPPTSATPPPPPPATSSAARPTPPPVAPTTTRPATTATSPAPPPPSPPPRSASDAKEKKDEEDKERGLEWLWLSGEGGLQHLSLTTISSEGKLVPGIEKTAATGPFAGVAAGLRLWILTLGVRARAAQFSDFMYWSLNPELAIRFSTQGVQPYLLFSAGYSALGSLDKNSLSSQAGAKVQGFNVRAGFGLDFYLTHTISLGLLGTGEVTAMTRPGVSASDLNVNSQVGAQGSVNTNDPQQTQAQIEAAKAEADAKAAKVDGSGVGLAGALSVVLGLHFLALALWPLRNRIEYSGPGGSPDEAFREYFLDLPCAGWVRRLR